MCVCVCERERERARARERERVCTKHTYSTNTHTQTHTHTQPTHACTFNIHRGVSEQVVLPALVGVREDRVRCRDFFEFFLELGVPARLVGVVLDGQFAVGVFDLCIARATRHTQHLRATAETSPAVGALARLPARTLSVQMHRPALRCQRGVPRMNMCWALLLPSRRAPRACATRQTCRRRCRPAHLVEVQFAPLPACRARLHRDAEDT